MNEIEETHIVNQWGHLERTDLSIPTTVPDRPLADMVREFHLKFGHPVRTEPRLVDSEEFIQVMKWVRDELDELFDAFAAGDLVEFVDALSDTSYFLAGLSWRCGVNLDKVNTAVHESNMSKLGADGKPIYGPDGKIQKGPNYFTPKLGFVLGVDTTDD